MSSVEISRSAKIPFRKVYAYLALLIPMTLFGFWKTYFALLGDLPEHVDLLVQIHAFLMFLWLLMLISQAWLIRTRRYRVHRLIGSSSYVLAPLIILFGLATLHHEFSRTLEGARLDVLAFGMIVAFAISWGLAIGYRKRPQLHMRYMVSTAYAFGTAIVFRVLFNWVPGFGTFDSAILGNGVVLLLLLSPLIITDWRAGMKRSPYWVIAVIIGLKHIAYWTFANTDGWLAFCQWIGNL